MSESDYQRGLRGGSCPVSIHEYERWKDWKDGNEAYERAQEKQDEEYYMSLLSPEEKRKRLDYKIKEINQKETKRLEYEAKSQMNRRKQAFKREADIYNTSVISICVLTPIICVIIYFIFWVVFKNSPILPITICMIIAIYNIARANSNYTKTIEKLKEKQYF